MATKGTRRRFPHHRSTVLDIVSAARSVPAFPLLKRIPVQPLDELRRRTNPRIGWTALFAKAYSAVSMELPELRDIFVSYPRPILYRHDSPVVSISIHRRDEHGNERLIWGRIQDAQQLPLDELQNRLSAFCESPLADVYREGLILESFPRVARRLAWWCVMRWSGRKRAKHVGTFSISSLAGQGCLNLYHPLITSTSLAFGPIQQDGFMDVALLCDHRVLDGVLGSRAIQTLEHELLSSTMSELQSLQAQSQAA